MIWNSAPDTERMNPFHSHCAPYAFQISSPLFQDRLRIRFQPRPKNDKKDRADRHERLFQEYSKDLKAIFIITDGSKRQFRTGYSVTVWHAGRIIKQALVSFVDNTSAYDAEMYALTHASMLIKKIFTLNPDINEALLSWVRAKM